MRRVVVLGAGFGGLWLVKALRPRPSLKNVEIVVVDRTNHHLFQPLLYQVATAGLAGPQIAQPIRQILSRRRDVRVLLDDVVALDLAARQVQLAQRAEPLPYDVLVVALGVQNDYFGHPEWERFAPGMKTLEDAARIRRDLLLALEEAESSADPERVKKLLTMVVIGGGPTGVELAGAIAELARFARRDFRNADLSRTRVVLVEKAPRVLGHLDPELSASAARQLAGCGVEVRTGVGVADIGPERVTLETGEVLEAATILWAAGVHAVPLTAQLGAPIDRAGRVLVAPDLTVPGHPEVFAIGDLVSLVDANGVRVPGVSPAAMQMARHVARQVPARLAGDTVPGPAFTYRDKGSMATIGRKAAVAQIGRLQLSGYKAWLAWLLIHLLFLIGLRNRLFVLVDWISAYLFYKPGAWIVFGRRGDPPGGT